RDAAYSQAVPWRGRWDTEGGGVLVNQSPHQLDILLWLMGPVTEVAGYWANVNHPSVEVDDTAVASIRFATGGLGSIATSVSQKPGIYTKVHIHGSNGASVGVETGRGAGMKAPGNDRYFLNQPTDLYNSRPSPTQGLVHVHCPARECPRTRPRGRLADRVRQERDDGIGRHHDGHARAGEIG